MLMQRRLGALLICLALGGCCTDGTMCMSAPTSGPAMAWDGGQASDSDLAPVKRPRRPRKETGDTVVGQQQGIESDPAASAGIAGEKPDEAALAEAQLKQKLVICRGCQLKQPTAKTEAALPAHELTASASQ